MKNFKLNLCDAFIERLVNLASLETSSQFQGVYLDALENAVDERSQLRRSEVSCTDRVTGVCCVPCGCCHNA